MSDTVGMPDPEEILLARRKLIAIYRAKRRLNTRLEDIEWEFRFLKPKIRELEKRVVTLGQLPSPVLVEDDDDDQVPDKKPSHPRLRPGK